MKYVYNFIWDNNKNKSNKIKHKVNFEQAKEVFEDAVALTIFDENNSNDEDRWLTLGRIKNESVLLVVHTHIEYNQGLAEIRIISARKATVKEKSAYELYSKG
jgi:uncharacterized DUF497 family protein